MENCRRSKNSLELVCHSWHYFSNVAAASPLNSVNAVQRQSRRLDRIAYHPKPKTKPAKKRKRLAKKIAERDTRFI
jgi:hypothetical protein